MSTPQIFSHTTFDAQAESLADKVSSMLQDSISKQDSAILILPGGSSPVKLITQLAQRQLPWGKIQITVTDERCVPIHDKQSNIGQIIRLFEEQNIFISPDPLWDETDQNISTTTFPISNAVTILGMGLDGHIASLFPNQNWFSKETQIIHAEAPSEPKKRISFNMETLLSSKHLILLVNGAEKWALYQRIVNGEAQGTPLGKLIDLARDKLRIHVVDK